MEVRIYSAMSESLWQHLLCNTGKLPRRETPTISHPGRLAGNLAFEDARPEEGLDEHMDL